MKHAIVFVLVAGLGVGAPSAVFAAAETPVTLQKSFTANKVTVDGYRGTLTLTTAAPGASVSVRASGKPDVMKRLDVRQDANGVLIRFETRSNDVWWPWSVLDWSGMRNDDLVLTIGAPKGTEFDLDDVAGTVRTGDLDAPLKFGGIGGGSAKFGNVSRARIEVAGSMDVSLGNSQGPLDVEMAGSGTVIAGSSTQVRLEMAGSGAFTSGPISGGLDASIAGSGDAVVASVNGPVSLDMAGSTTVAIKSGKADPLKVSIAGSGDVDFGGEAVNPNVEIAGSGTVTVGTMSGT